MKNITNFSFIICIFANIIFANSNEAGSWQPTYEEDYISQQISGVKISEYNNNFQDERNKRSAELMAEMREKMTREVEEEKKHRDDNQHNLQKASANNTPEVKLSFMERILERIFAKNLNK